MSKEYAEYFVLLFYVLLLSPAFLRGIPIRGNISVTDGEE
jgi:hypothetical protein